MKKALRTVAFVLVLIILACTMLSCGSNTGKTLMRLDGQSVSVNLYKFYLSRIKGTLATYGYNVTSEAFWNTVIDMSGKTWNDYYLEQVLDETKQSLIVLKMFSDLEKEGKLKFTDKDKAEIEERVDLLIEYDADSSVSKFNSILGQYGANVDVLKLAYEIEVKRAKLVEYYFGANGSQISDVAKDEYMHENYIAFRQILISKFYYEYECDANGDAIYYTDKGWRAYDKINGKPNYDAEGKPEYDSDGNIIYYGEDGRIAYDVANGKRKNILDDKGNPKIVYYSETELEERFSLVEEIVDSLPDKDTDKFEYNMLKYAEYANTNADDVQYTCYLKKNETSAYDYINDIREAILDIGVGEIKVVSSDYGYHIIMKYDLEEGAYSDEKNAAWFKSFNQDITNKLLKTHTEKYVSDIALRKELLNGISMIDAGINFYY